MKKSKTQELDFIISDEIKTVGELGIQKITKILNAIYNLMIIWNLFSQRYEINIVP